MTSAAGGIEVLYVGDEGSPDVVARLGNEREGFDVSVESDPETALRRLDGYACVLAEHAPPAVDGVSFLKEARKSGSEVPILLLADGAVLGPATAGYDPPGGDLTEGALAGEIRRAVDRDSDANPSRSSPPTAELHRVINQAIARARSRDQIEQAVCEGLADSDACRFVWIGGLDEDGVMVHRASAGYGKGYLEEVRDTGDWSGAGSGPMGHAIRTHELQYVGDIAEDPLFEPWRESALDRGYRSVAAVPLLFEGRIQGAIILYSGVTDPFGPDERTLLAELGTTVAHALEAIDARNEAHRFEQAVEHAGHAIYLGDADGTIQYVNPAFEEITGYPFEDAIGRNPGFLHVEGLDEERVGNLWAALEDGDTWSEEIYERRASGEVYLAQQTIAPIGQDGTEGYVVVQTDITRRRLREQRLSVMNRVLRHNLRNDANVILGGVSNAIDISGDPVVQEALTPVADAAERLISTAERARHVDQVLEWVHSSDRHVDSLQEMIKRVQESAADQYQNATILVHTPEDDIVADSSLELAIEELVGNAVQHADKGDPRVEISVTRRGDGDVELSISDDGPGIPENERETLEQGYETQLTHGVGLGLWFVYWIVTSAGGVIDIDDDPDGGSVVTLVLPTTEESP